MSTIVRKMGNKKELLGRKISGKKVK